MTDEKLGLQETAKRLSLPPSTLNYWLRAAKNGQLGEIGKMQRPLTEVELELAKTKRELAEIKMERDLLKKAAAYFARGIR
jgi:transposase